MTMNATATELNKHPGKCLNRALKEPVVIERSGEPIVVMVSYEFYQRLEDAYWGELAIQADKEPSLSIEESTKFLQED